jgi:hypothetical protein
MRVCGECGKTLEGAATRCPFCSSTKVTYVLDRTPAAAAEPERKEGEIALIFDREHPRPGGEEPAAETAESAEAAPEEDAGPSAFSTALHWAGQPRHALLLGAALLVLGGIAWWALAPHRTQVVEVAADPRAVDPVLAREFSKLVDAALPEKLEWGRDVLRKRIPARFPEELLMEIDRETPEIRFSNDEKNEAYYRFSIAYHYKETNKKIFAWTSVQFFFEQRNGKWLLAGDRWPREWEVMFE